MALNRRLAHVRIDVGHIECQSRYRMGKACCASGCVNGFCKGNGIKFYRFPVDVDRRRRWIAALSRKDWQPSEYSWLCSVHFVTGTVSLYYYYDINTCIYGENDVYMFCRRKE